MRTYIIYNHTACPARGLMQKRNKVSLSIALVSDFNILECIITSCRIYIFFVVLHILATADV